MAGTFAQLHFHIIFSTKDRSPTIAAPWRERLWEYLGGIIVGEGGAPLQIGGMADHVHILVTLRPRHHLPDLIQKLKAGSSGWVHRQFPEAGMWWQNGYGAFTVSHSGLQDVRQYIIDQEVRHKTMSFQDEFRVFLDKHSIAYDERYLWG